MNIAGITRVSAVDYPGRICLTIHTQGCNRECEYCHSKELLDPGIEGPVLWEDVIDTLLDRRAFYDAVVFSGGEPCLQEDLAEHMAEVGRYGLLVGLHTNGDYLTPEIAEQADLIVLSHGSEQKREVAAISGNVWLSRVVREGDGWRNELTEWT